MNICGFSRCAFFSGVHSACATPVSKSYQVGVQSFYGSVRKFHSDNKPRDFHSLPYSKAELMEIMEKRVLNEPLVWSRDSIIRCKADLGNGLTAFVYVGAEDTDTCITVTDGLLTVYREIPEYWLANWSVEVQKPVHLEKSGA